MRGLRWLSWMAATVAVTVCTLARAADETTTLGKKNLVLPGESFVVAGRTAFIFWPEESKRRTPQPWVLYSPTLPAYPDQSEKWMHQQFVDAGVAVAGIDVGEAFGSPSCREALTALADELTTHRGFADRPCLLGRSRGGLWASSWAIANPDRVAGLAGIYPVFDLQTYPGLKRAAPAYGLTEDELQSRLPTLNPIAKSSTLAAAGVPVFLVHGDRDKVVPLVENSLTLFEQYKAAGHADRIELIIPSGQGHNFWPGFFRCQDLVDFVIARARSGAGVSPKKARKNPRPAATVMVSDLEYQSATVPPMALDLVLPRRGNGDTTVPEPFPVVVWIHGGGWANGSKDSNPMVYLAEHGYAVASIDYRLTGQASWPAQIDDCRAAIRWIRKQSAEYHVDPDRIGVAGGSAGGHLVALLGTMDAPEDEAVSSRVAAVVDFYGPSDLLTMPNNVLSEGRTIEDLAATNGAKLLGGTVRDRPELAKQASAITHVSKDDSPFLILHGAIDPMVPLDQSERLHRSLEEAGVESTLIVLPDGKHGGPAFSTEEVRERVRGFYDRYLKEE